MKGSSFFVYFRKNNNGFNSDTDEVNNTVITVLVSMFSIAGIILLVLGLVYFYRKTRLGGAFKHRRMAENLLSNNIEFSNQMYMPEEEEDDSDIIIMRDANNFSNPVYDSMFGPGKVSAFFKVIRLGLVRRRKMTVTSS